MAKINEWRESLIEADYAREEEELEKRNKKEIERERKKAEPKKSSSYLGNLPLSPENQTKYHNATEDEYGIPEDREFVFDKKEKKLVERNKDVDDDEGAR